MQTIRRKQVFHYTDTVQITKQIDETRASRGERAAAVAQTSLYRNDVPHTKHYFFVNDIILRPFFGRRATHFRLADCRSSGAFLAFEMFYNYEKVRASSPHSSVETRMP